MNKDKCNIILKWQLVSVTCTERVMTMIIDNRKHNTDTLS